MSISRPIEPPWWGDRDAIDARRALIENFDVGDLEQATAELRERCEALEGRQAVAEPLPVGEIAEVLLAQWSVAFLCRLADSQRHYYDGDEERLGRAAEAGRTAAVRVRDQFLAPDRIGGDLLQQALSLAGENVKDRHVSRDRALTIPPSPGLGSSTDARQVIEAHHLWSEARIREAAHPDDGWYAEISTLAWDRLRDLYAQLGPAGRAAVARDLGQAEAARLDGTCGRTSHPARPIDPPTQGRRRGGMHP